MVILVCKFPSGDLNLQRFRVKLDTLLWADAGVDLCGHSTGDCCIDCRLVIPVVVPYLAIFDLVDAQLISHIVSILVSEWTAKGFILLAHEVTMASTRSPLTSPAGV